MNTSHTRWERTQRRKDRLLAAAVVCVGVALLLCVVMGVWAMWRVVTSG